ncbi:MAG: DUF4197 domain-containing protein [Saprospiraceae bacterium]|nr:DUF4197 domain-containing protein [Saprospiraceae bacterium]
MWIRVSLLALILSFTSCDVLQEVQSTLGEPSVAEIASGLKEALRIGVSKGSEQLSQDKGYFDSPYKILLPAEARKVTDKLSKVPGFATVENEIVKKLNQAAEDAAKSAKPIFVDAIKSMTFEDATNILLGADDAATRYLEDETSRPLYNEFQPVIVNSLNKFNAIEYWEKAITTYNKIPFVDQVNPRLDDYVTEEALKGMFGMVEQEEQKIRTDVSARTSQLLKKVFAKQDS